MYTYYILKELFLARSIEIGKFEWFKNGEWVKDFHLSIYLMDCIMGYGDVSAFDYEEISEEQANLIIKEGGLD